MSDLPLPSPPQTWGGKIFTTGYNQKGWTPEKLLIEAKRLNAIVVDIRKSAKSWNSEWCYRHLRDYLGKRWYFWCPAFGNVNYANDGPIQIANPVSGMKSIATILQHNSGVILMCGCRSLDGCHRQVVAEMLRDYMGLEYEEITPPTAQLELF